MEAYQERVITEQKELAEKIVKLTTFITDQEKVLALSDFEWMILCEQLEAMLEYHKVLIVRIIKFNEG